MADRPRWVETTISSKNSPRIYNILILYLDNINILWYNALVIDSMCVLRRNAEPGFLPGSGGIYLALHTLLPLYVCAGSTAPFFKDARYSGAVYIKSRPARQKGVLCHSYLR